MKLPRREPTEAMITIGESAFYSGRPSRRKYIVSAVWKLMHDAAPEINEAAVERAAKNLYDKKPLQNDYGKIPWERLDEELSSSEEDDLLHQTLHDLGRDKYRREVRDVLAALEEQG